MFTISNKADEQTFISLRGLVKNNGFFKSAAQQKFMLKSYGKEQMDTKMLGYLGITLKDSDSMGRLRIAIDRSGDYHVCD